MEIYILQNLVDSMRYKRLRRVARLGLEELSERRVFIDDIMLSLVTSPVPFIQGSNNFVQPLTKQPDSMHSRLDWPST